MRVFVVTMLVVSEWEAQRTESKVEEIDFHAACVHAVQRAVRERARVLSITEIKQPPKLVS